MMFTSNKKTDGDVRSQALAWYVERLDGEPSPQDEAAFEVWLAADPAHEQEYRQLDVLCGQLGAFGNAPQIEQAKAYAARYRATTGRAGYFRWLGGAGQGRGLALAASVALIFAGWAAFNTGVFLPDDGHYSTALGEQLSVELADGSTVRLNTATEIDVVFSESERRILLRRGQASFDVAHNAVRPFVVEAGEGTVTAVGTVFDVYDNGEAVTVTLIEGIVEVRQRDDVAAVRPALSTAGLQSATDDETDPAATQLTVPGPAARTVAELYAGDQISMGPGRGLTPVARVDVARVMAWEDGMIDLQNTPLREALLEVNRYSSVKLELTNDSLADVEVSGIFRVGKPENFVRALEVRFGLHATRPAKNRILLEPAAAG